MEPGELLPLKTQSLTSACCAAISLMRAAALSPQATKLMPASWVSRRLNRARWAGGPLAKKDGASTNSDARAEMVASCRSKGVGRSFLSAGEWWKVVLQPQGAGFGLPPCSV
jgi:hypothetical protein